MRWAMETSHRAALIRAIWPAPNDIAVYEVLARPDSHADDRRGSVAFRQAA
jgi:hypothetical protein